MMPFKQIKFLPQTAAEKAGFAPHNHEVVRARINEIVASRDSLRSIIHIPKSSIEIKETAVGQAGRVLEQNAQVELPPEITAGYDSATPAEAREIVAQAFTDRRDISIEASPAPATVIQEPTSPEIMAAQEAVRAAQSSGATNTVVQFPAQPSAPQSQDARKAA